MSQSLVPVLLAVILIVFLAKSIDRFTFYLEKLMKRSKIPYDSFAWDAGYTIVFVMSYLACWQLNFSFLDSFSIIPRHPEAGWFFTAIIICGGTAWLQEDFDLIDRIPGALRGIMSYGSSFLSNTISSSASKTTPSSTPEPSSTPATPATALDAPESNQQGDDT